MSLRSAAQLCVLRRLANHDDSYHEHLQPVVAAKDLQTAPQGAVAMVRQLLVPGLASVALVIAQAPVQEPRVGSALHGRPDLGLR